MEDLKKMKTMISSLNKEPNYALAQLLAYETVKNSTQSALPISIKKIIRSFPNLHIQKYTVFAKERYLTLNEVFHFANSEEGCLWMRTDGTYLILYNDTIDNTGRVRFTLAHELGHYVLKHNEKTGKTLLSRYSLSDEEYDLFEKEANYFAKRLLAPIPLVDLYLEKWTKIQPSNIEFAFDTSYTVANHVINGLNKRQRYLNISKESHPLINNFIDFINKDTSSKICNTCHYLQSINHKFCSLCGNSDFTDSSLESYSHYFIERKKQMIYSKIETNENDTPIKCPRCGAEELEDDYTYCPWCAVYLHNVCLGGEENRFVEDYRGDWVEKSLDAQYQDDSSCSGFLDGGFRYCPKCGSETSYYRQKLLDSWETELNQEKDSSNESIDNSRVELPF